MSNKGDRRERELVNKLYDNGFAVMRAPSSGGGTKRELPDVFAGNGEKIVVIEAKSSSGDPIYIKEQEVIDLKYFGKGFNAEVRIAVRFDREEWYFFHPDDLYQTNSGNYRVKKEKALTDGIDFKEFIGESKKKLLSDF